MANLTPSQSAGGAVSGTRESGAFSGIPDSGTDATNEPGQYPNSLFGVQLPQGTGAGGSAGAGRAADPTNEPGQLTEGISGSGPSVVADSGAPGSQGATNGGPGPDTVSYTRPGSFLSGTNQMDTVHETISGPGDWTQAIDGSYAGGGPQLPGIKGNEPTAGGGRYQPGSGQVRRGGYRRGQR